MPEDISGYDNIFVGYPNWWGTMPMCMFTVLEKLDLNGKNIIPFCANEGSGMTFQEPVTRYARIIIMWKAVRKPFPKP